MTAAITTTGREIRGQNLDFLYDQSNETILSGPAGTGKSITALTKLMLVALKYPGCRLLIARKTRESLSVSGLTSYQLAAAGILVGH